MAVNNHYDIIIIGSGAGGGTLAHKLAPTGKKILILERGGYVPREKDNWNPRAVNLEGKYQTKEKWHDATATSCIRIPIIMWAATPNSSARRCFGCARKISAKSNTMAACRPLGRSLTMIWSRITRKQKNFITYTAMPAKIPPSRTEARPTLMRQ